MNLLVNIRRVKGKAQISRRGSRKAYFKHSSNIRKSLFDLEVNTFQPNMYLNKVSNMTIIEEKTKKKL